MAGSITTIYSNLVPLPPNTQTVFVVDVASGELIEILTSQWSESPGSPQAQFSPDGSRLFFEAPVARDHVFPFDPTFYGAPVALFQYDFASGALQKLTGFEVATAVPANGRLAVWARPSDVGLDPEGTNSDASEEVFILDPDTEGGFLHVKYGRITQAPNGGCDRFTVSGTLFQPSGALDASSNDVTLTLLGANGQIFRATRPGTSSRHAGNGARMSDANAATLDAVAIRTRDHLHYTFRATGRGPGIFQNATPYLTAELEVGNAVFSNAQPWHQKGQRLLYP